MAIDKEQVIDEGVRTAVITVGAEATIVNAAELKEGILSGLKECDAVRVDVTSVSEADMSFLQIICALHRSAIVSGKKVTVYGYRSGNISELAETAGFTRHVGCFEEHTCIWSGGNE